MKKINLKGISEVLSEKELKNIMAGSQSKEDACKEKSAGELCYFLVDGSQKVGKCVGSPFFSSLVCFT